VKQPIKGFLAGGVLALALFGIAAARPLEHGEAAYLRGDYATAMSLWRPLAERGNAVAQARLGWMYEKGEGVPQDYAQAAAWYLKAAEQGNAVAQSDLGVMYEYGEGVPQDYAQAAAWYRKAAEQGNAVAQSNFGAMYEKGEGVPQDYAQAAAWYRKAAEQGNAVGQSNLGLMYEYGEGVPQDYAQAAAWYRKAAEQGNAIAENALRVLCSDNSQAVCTAIQSNTVGLGKYASAIPLKRQDNTFLIPVVINGSLVLDFIIDSGASDVSIPADVFLTLMRTGTIRNEDFLGSKEYQLADGSTVPSETFMIRTLKVGNRELENVTGSVARVEGSLLLGQSFLTRFRSWSIDNERGVLLLN